MTTRYFLCTLTVKETAKVKNQMSSGYGFFKCQILHLNIF